MQTCSALFVDPPGGMGSIVKWQAEVPEPGAGEITVRIHASSLNYHDYLVVAGKMRLKTRRIPMSDGAGEVVAVGLGVRDLKVGDAVVSSVSGQQSFQLPTGFAHIEKPSVRSASRVMPRQMTMFPGGGSLARAS